MYDNVGKKVNEILMEDNILVVYDVVEEYMIDNEVFGGYVMFVLVVIYCLLKNVKGVSKIFMIN